MKVTTVCLLLLFSAGPVLALHPLDDDSSTPWLGPEIFEPEEAGIGKVIDDIPFERLDRKKSSLRAMAGEKGTVVVVRDPECPVSTRYGPRVANMARAYTAEGFRFIFIYLNNNVASKALRDDARALQAPGVKVGKGSFKLAEVLGVKSTGDVFVLDSRRRLIYRGAVDDQYGFGYTQDTPTHNYLRNALDALLYGRPVAEPATLAPGCIIDADPAKDELFPIPPGGALS